MEGYTEVVGVKIIKIEVESCEVCLNVNQYPNDLDEAVYYCMDARNGAGKQPEIDDITQIPKWCPLEDAQTKPI